jgi:endonuclease/exonuclease/phosphatase family metal-dependent hydrolase
MTKRACIRSFLFIVLCAARLHAAEPIDMFSDVPKLNNDFIRIGAWNLRHINLEGDADEFLPGETEEEDFEILVATFAKAIEDLGLDVVAIVEHQPRANEPNRLVEILNRLNGGDGDLWRSDETQIVYENPNHPFSNLQFGLLWDSAKVTVDPTDDELLSQLRQPRNSDGELVHERLRAPWLVPIECNQLHFDLMVLHLKSGGGFPQEDEVAAIEDFIRDRQSSSDAGHLIMLGDFNIRPDQPQGRSRLSRLTAPTSSGELMRMLTVTSVYPSLDGWSSLGSINSADPVAGLVPFTHFNANSLDTFLDHIAISRTFDEIYDHPVHVTTADGRDDIRPGFEIARPLIPEPIYHELTDHLPVIVTLRTTSGDAVQPAAPSLRIVSVIPNPIEDDRQHEQVTVRNVTDAAISLESWKVGDSGSGRFWELTADDGTVSPGQTLTIIRQGRSMALNNSDGDSVKLINPEDEVVDVQAFGDASSGQIFQFE